MMFSKDILRNQLVRDTPPIAASFDRLALDKLGIAGEFLADATSVFFPQLIKYGLDDLKLEPTCARLLNQAAETFIGSIHLARGGYRRQYGLLARSVVESLAVVLQLYSTPDLLDAFYAGKLSAPKSISHANRMLPLFGRLYGHLSNLFVHTGEMHAQLHKLNAYNEDDQALEYILSNVRLNASLLYIVSELVFYDFVQHPRYWNRLQVTAEGSQFIYNPSDEERKRMEALFQNIPDHDDEDAGS